MDMIDTDALAAKVLDIASEAGAAVMEVYGREFSTTEKDDRSPLTEADLRSNEVITRGLASIDGTPILSEESAQIAYADRRGWTRFWLVDPLDGTKEFIKRNGEFTVNIALIENSVPVLAVVYAPAMGVTYWAAGGRAFKREADGVRQIAVADYSGGILKVVASRSHAGPETEAFLDHLRTETGDLDLLSIGSSLKLCMVAEGQAHLYPRLGPTMEWDVAAADAVVRAAGGEVVALDGNALTYNKENLLNPFFVVRSRDEKLLQLTSAAMQLAPNGS